MSKLINITALQRASETYDDTLRLMPFNNLIDELNALEINLLRVDGKHKIVIFQRKGGIARPYKVGGINTVSDEEIGKAIERVLDPKECFTALKDDINNYKDKKVVSNKGESVDNTTKKHPLEVRIIASKLATVGEDILNALFFAKRDETDQSPMGMFDGINELINKEITAGDVAVAKGNMFNTGAFAMPDDETDSEAFDKLVAFIRSANPFLRRKGILYITQGTLFKTMEALGNKIRYKNSTEYEVFVKHLAGICQAPGLKIVSHPALGSGDRLLYTIPDNLDFGLGTDGAEQFVQIRDPYEDPNIAQFWMQWTAGARVTAIHPKEFLVNDQVNSGADLISGDYS